MEGRKLVHELIGLVLLFFSLLLLLSLLTFHSGDPALNHVTSTSATVHNKAGLFGAYMAGFLNDVFGIASFAWPLCLGGFGAGYISLRFGLCWRRWLGYVLLAVCLLASGAAWDFSLGDVHGGGMLGRMLYTSANLYLSPIGSSLLLLFGLLIATQLAFDISWRSMARRVIEVFRGALSGCLDGKIRLPKREDIKPICMAFAKRLLKKMSTFRKFTLPQVMPELKSDSDVVLHKKTAKSPLISLEDIPVVSEKEDKREFPSGVAVSLADMPVESVTQEQSPELSSVQTDFSQQTGKFENSDNISESDTGSASLYNEVELPWARDEEILTHPEKDDANSDNEVNFDVPVDLESSPEEKPVKKGETPSGDSRSGKKALIPFPPIDLLVQAKPMPPSRENREERGQLLVNCLSNFGVEGVLQRITPGPVVTMYEYKPAAGVRVSKIVGLVDDVALAMKARSIRIQAPIPGQDTVGIEIPNETRELVNFREILCDPSFTRSASPLTMVIGKDISGKPYTADLSTMPHLLVAGETGAGKSVCINAIIMSFLYKARPENLQMLLVDPKRVELSVYADLPHLVHPVVTEMEHAKTALDWAVQEMQQRYDAMASLQVRNIAGYNEKYNKIRDSLPPELSHLRPMPYLVIIIDELADLMMTTSRKEVEHSIVRLAQLARAAGIHMILATQRPSVDVVTGLIKANFPSRISFHVSQKVDSRTILDAMGAETLLGKGDMLFKASGGRLLRMHGPFVSDEEVGAVVDYWKKQQKPHYEIDFSEWVNENTGKSSASVLSGESSSDDALYADVLAFVNEQGKASISLIQRRFKIGFNRAARLFEELERDGVVGPSDGSSRPRSVIH